MKLLKFSGAWCGPCKMQAQELKEHPVNIEVEEIDINTDKNDLAIEYNIRTIPTMILLDDNKEVHRWTGFTKSEVINEYIDVYLNT